MHGGGWSRGSKDMLGPAATALAEQGFVVLAQEYRLTGEAPFPANIHDVKRAIRWAKENAGELGFDPEKLCLEGHSAGAHLVLLAAGTPDDARARRRPRAWATCRSRWRRSAPSIRRRSSTIDGERPSGALAAARAAGRRRVRRAAAELASPMSTSRRAYPPVMLLHGDADKVVPVSRLAPLRGAGARRRAARSTCTSTPGCRTASPTTRRSARR